MFTLDNIIIDRIQMAIAEDFDGNLLYTLTQLSEANIEVTAESKDAKDKDGTLIKRFWQGKSGTFTCKNAMLNLNVIGEASGTGKKSASNAEKIVMPKILLIKSGATATLKDVVNGTVRVCGLTNSGTMGKSFAQSTVASDTEFGLTSGGVLTVPTSTEYTQYIVKYDRNVESGVVIENKANEFPRTVKLTLKCLCVDPCSADTLRSCIIELSSFQVSPEVNITFNTDATLDFKGALQVDYCSDDKTLYKIYVAEDDVE